VYKKALIGRSVGPVGGEVRPPPGDAQVVPEGVLRGHVVAVVRRVLFLAPAGLADGGFPLPVGPFPPGGADGGALLIPAGGRSLCGGGGGGRGRPAPVGGGVAGGDHLGGACRGSRRGRGLRGPGRPSRAPTRSCSPKARAGRGLLRPRPGCS